MPRMRRKVPRRTSIRQTEVVAPPLSRRIGGGESRAIFAAACVGRLSLLGCDGLARGIQPTERDAEQTVMKAIRQNMLRPILALAVAIAASRVLAGGGPENVLLLVNSNSLNSKTIANHYIALRNIPASNVVYIDWRGGLEGCQALYFNEQILQPAIKSISERGLAAQIDYVVYSCDFPWRVNLTSLMPDGKFAQATKPEASCTGATFLWQYMRDKNPAMVMPNVNWYVSPNESTNFVRCVAMNKVETRGFQSRYAWAPDGSHTNDRTQGQSYVLSTMLGVTTGRGNTVAEIIEYLKRAVAADGTQPSGSFYYMKNNDVRSQTRHDCYEAAVTLLKQLGANAVVASGVLPNGASDVLGIMTGADQVKIAQAGLKLKPGAIVDNFTSYGGMLEAKPWQTPISDYMRMGAAGAAGTVFEPMALQYKFALASLFIHYARGCSLAEAYYQSVAGPYMLLIVGDPLCQPFAVAPTVAVEGIQPGQEVKGMLAIKAVANAGPLRKVGALELFVDGRLVARFPPGTAPQINTAQLSDGYHELRLVAINGDAIESRGRRILPIVVNNHGRKLEFKSSAPSYAATEMVHLEASQAGAETIVVRQNRREVARFQGGQGKADVLAATFGRGPVLLQAESEGAEPALSAPLRLEIR